MPAQAHLPLHLRERRDSVRTEASLRSEAAKHFQFLVDYPSCIDRDRAQAERLQTMGISLVEAVLNAPVGELFPVFSWLAAQGYSETEQTLAQDLLPYLTGSLRLLEMEFAHVALGVLPFSVVRDILQTQGAPVYYQGVALTGDNVFVQYRRLPLNTEVIY